MWFLDISYPTKGPYAYEWGSLDHQLLDAVGEDNTIGSAGGTDMITGDRDATYDFDSEIGANAAKKRVEALKLPGIKVAVRADD